jgi:amino acid adenylation domain-containing protein
MSPAPATPSREESPRVESIAARFARVAAQFPDRCAVSASDAKWSYAELDAFSGRIAAEIIRNHPPGDEPIALLMKHGARQIGAILGVLKAGRMYLVLEPGQSKDAISVILADANARFLIHDVESEPLLPSGDFSRLAKARVETMADSSAHMGPLPDVPPGAPAWLMHTSGSTGKPKGVWQDQIGLICEADVYAELIHLRPEDRLTLLASCGLSASGLSLYGALLHGAAVCPFSLRTQGIGRLAGWMRDERITVYHSVPSVFRDLVRTMAPGRRFESVRLVRLGGEQVWPHDAESCARHFPPGCRLMQSLSSTETGLISTYTVDEPGRAGGGRLPAGKAVPGVEILLVDDRQKPVPYGADGRIVVKSERLRQGYWRRPDETAERFKTDPDGAERRMFLSADMGRFLPDGNLEHLGRGDQVVKIHGLRADLSEIEAAIEATGLFEEAAVIAVEDGSGGQRLVAYLVPRGQALESADCRKALAKRLPGHMIPQDFVFMGRLPRSGAGKVERRALPAPPTRSSPAGGGRPRDVLERRLSEIWEEVLGTAGLGVKDDFFDLGGSSLQSVEVLLKIEEIFGVSLSPAILLEHSTIESLARFLAGATVSQAASPLVQLRTAESGRPLFLIHSAHGNVAAYAQLARRLTGRPIYGLQSPGLSGECWPLTTVPAMAERYLKEVLAVDPHGPHLLVGTCTGGLVVFEIALRLVRLGKPPSLIVLLSTAAPPYSGARAHFDEDWIDPIRDGFRKLRWRAVRAIQGRVKTRQLPAYRRFVANMNDHARRIYRPKAYEGDITLVSSTEPTGLTEDRRLLMAQYARNARPCILPGPRGEILTPPAVDLLATQMQSWIEEAERRTALP